MKKILSLLAAGLLTLAIAAPVSAVPVQNPQVSTWEIFCPAPLGTWTVTAKGVPGWSTDWSPGTTPILFEAGTFNIWENGVIVAGPGVETAPPGLTPKLAGPCWFHLLGGSTATFDIVATDVWFFVP